MSRSKRDDRGAAMVEFAIVLPVLMLILLGIIEFGRAYNAQVSIQAAAREGARELALRPQLHRRGERHPRRRPLGGHRRHRPDPCPATGDGQARVTITESFSFMVLPFGPLDLTATGAMRCGL